MIQNPEYVIIAAAIGIAGIAATAVGMTLWNRHLDRKTAGLPVRLDTGAALAEIEARSVAATLPLNRDWANTKNRVASDFAFNGYPIVDTFQAHSQSIFDAHSQSIFDAHSQSIFDAHSQSIFDKR